MVPLFKKKRLLRGSIFENGSSLPGGTVFFLNMIMKKKMAPLAKEEPFSTSEGLFWLHFFLSAHKPTSEESNIIYTIIESFRIGHCFVVFRCVLWCFYCVFQHNTVFSFVSFCVVLCVTLCFLQAKTLYSLLHVYTCSIN